MSSCFEAVTKLPVVFFVLQSFHMDLISNQAKLEACKSSASDLLKDKNCSLSLTNKSRLENVQDRYVSDLWVPHWTHGWPTVASSVTVWANCRLIHSWSTFGPVKEHKTQLPEPIIFLNINRVLKASSQLKPWFYVT